MTGPGERAKQGGPRRRRDDAKEFRRAVSLACQCQQEPSQSDRQKQTQLTDETELGIRENRVGRAITDGIGPGAPGDLGRNQC
jgi:hypothetical protein